MEAFDFDNVMSPVEKSTDNFLMFSYHFKSIARLFRIVEILVGVAFLSWTSSYLPFAFRISGEYLRQLLAIVISPLFIFLVGNLIVVTLLLKAGHFFSGGRSPAPENLTETGLYEDLIQNHDGSADFSSLISNIPAEVVYEDKQTILETSSAAAAVVNNKIEHSIDAEIAIPEKIPAESKAYARTQSENFQAKSKVQSVENDGKFRRWETMQSRKVANPGEIPADTVYVFDELTNEEFNQTIEAFIARQINFHREEQFAIVSS